MTKQLFLSILTMLSGCKDDVTPFAYSKHLPKAEQIIIAKAAERNGIHQHTDDYYLLLAIRKAENGGKGKEFGIMDKRAKNLDLQAAWCACTILNQHRRSKITNVNEAFLLSLSKRYCPIGASNDPTNLNQNWLSNVTYWFNVLKKEAC